MQEVNTMQEVSNMQDVNNMQEVNTMQEVDMHTIGKHACRDQSMYSQQRKLYSLHPPP